MLRRGEALGNALQMWIFPFSNRVGSVWIKEDERPWCSWAKRLIFDQMTEVWGKMLWWLTPVFLSCFGGHDKYRNVTLCQTWRPLASFQHHLDFLLWCLDNRLSIFQGPLTHPTTRMYFFSCVNHTQSPIVTLKVCNNAGWGGGAAVWLTGTAEHLEQPVHILE